MNLSELTTAEQNVHMQVYGRLPVAFVRGEGPWLWDTEGKRYLDMLAGIAVMSVGHGHPKVVAAIAEQAATLTHVSNLFYTQPQVDLAARLTGLLGWGKVFFANSGAEANECALKLARRATIGADGAVRSGVVAALGSFHGRTLTTLAATGQPQKHQAFVPLPGWFTHVPLNDIAALDAAIDEGTSAVLLEVVQGEAGVIAADPEYLRAARRLCDDRGALLIFDEVQTGLGRTGRWFAFQHADVTPDIVTLAKALGGGLPIGACIAQDSVAAAFGRGDHATTFGGGPVPCAAALAVLAVIEDEKLCENATVMGEQLVSALRAAIGDDPAVTDVRGVGLLVAVGLSEPIAAEVVGRCLAAGLVVNNVAVNAIRFAPPLTIDQTHIDHAVAILSSVLKGLA